MVWLLCIEAVVTMLLLATVVRRRGSSRLFFSEESAHASALARRTRHTPDRGMCATALTLGSDEGQFPCLLVSVSRSKIHLVAPRPVRTGEQLQVRKGDDYFVGEVRNVSLREKGYFLDLGVFSSNYRAAGPIAWIAETCSRTTIYLMRQFAIVVSRAQWRARPDR